MILILREIPRKANISLSRCITIKNSYNNIKSLSYLLRSIKILNICFLFATLWYVLSCNFLCLMISNFCLVEKFVITLALKNPSMSYGNIYWGFRQKFSFLLRYNPIWRVTYAKDVTRVLSLVHHPAPSSPTLRSDSLKHKVQRIVVFHSFFSLTRCVKLYELYVFIHLFIYYIKCIFVDCIGLMNAMRQVTKKKK